jgi:hypothetical protein
MKFINALLVPIFGLSAAVLASPVAVAEVEPAKGLVVRQADVATVLQDLYEDIKTHTGAISEFNPQLHLIGHCRCAVKKSANTSLPA